MELHINYLAVLVAAVVYFFIGALWYSVLFVKPWSKMMGFEKLDKKQKEKAKKMMGRSMAFNFLTTLMTSYCMAHEVQSGMNFYHTSGAVAGLMAGFWIWLGFIATSLLNTVIWEGRPFKLYLINVGYYLVSFMAVGAILAVWP